MERSDSSDSDSVALIIFFDIPKVISALMTPLTPPTPTRRSCRS